MLIDQKVTVKWNGANKKHYESHGYIYTGSGKEFLVELIHLSKASHSLVKFVCDYCEGENQIEEKQTWKTYKNLVTARKSTNKDCCNHNDCRSAKMKTTYLNNIVKNNKTIVDTHPQIIEQWSDKNDYKPSQFTSGSDQMIWWVCSKGHEWESQIKNRALRNTDCPFCMGVKVCDDNCLDVTHPQLSVEWHPSKNRKLTPRHIGFGSNKKVWWLGKCGHEWDDTVSHRIHGRKCPFCSGKRVDEQNCLDTLNPSLSSQWHITKNVNLTPFDVTLGSNKAVCWICEKGHEWEANISSRALGDQGCPFCAGRKVCLDNCLATLNPILSTEWNSNKNANLTPYDVTKSSSKNVWWTCNKCRHEWESTISNRTMGNGCPQCKESKGEKKVRSFLESNNIIFLPQYEFNNLRGLGGKPLKFDFALFNEQNALNILVEYDGEYHYNKVYDDDNHEKIVEHDKRKDIYCKKHNVPLLRIPYWDFDNIENILANELVKFDLL